MQVKKVQEYFQRYKAFLKSKRASQHLYIWESQKIFQENWDLEAIDLAQMYDQSLQNSHTRRLWKKERHAPKEMMLKFANMQPDFVRQMFRDLFYEGISAEGRCARFIFYCDQLLEEYKKQNPHSIDNNHYHEDDYWMISLYLSFRFPDQYCLYVPEKFRYLL